MYVDFSSFSMWGCVFSSNRKSALRRVVVVTAAVGVLTYYGDYFG